MFNDELLRGFIITSIDNNEVNIADIQVKFQKNRAIVFNLIVGDADIIKILLGETIQELKGKYYHYFFKATVDNKRNMGAHFPYYSFDIVVDLIEFSKSNLFFINSNEEFSFEIIPTENMTKYIKRKINQQNYKHKNILEELLSNKDIKKINYSNDIDFIESKNAIVNLDSYIFDDYVINIELLNRDDELINLLKFNNKTFENYNTKYRYLLELYSFIYNTPILIEKMYCTKDKNQNILFQSQHINEKIVEKLSDDFPLTMNSHFNCIVEKYLDAFVDFKTSQTTLDLLLKIYFLSDMYDGKESYHLNDISGIIDLFDGVFVELKIELDNINNSKSQRYKLSNNNNLESKISYILEKIEPELINYEIGNDKKFVEILSKFRNMIRHQNEFKSYELDKLFDFSAGVLRLYIIKYILTIEDTDYDIIRILEDFKIYPLVKHIYKYKNEKIIIYNVKLDNYGKQALSENSVYFQTLKEQKIFKDTLPKEFVYSGYKELKKVYIKEDDKIKRNLIFFGVIVYDNKILNSEKDICSIDISYDEFKSYLNIEEGI